MSRIFCFALLVAVAGNSAANQEADRHLDNLRKNDTVVQNLKTRAVNLLGAIDEYQSTNVYPPEQRIDVLLTSPARQFTVQRVQLRSGDQLLSDLSYAEDQVYAMRVGGLASLYHGNVAPGRLRLQVVLDGTRADGTPLTHKASMTVQKTEQPLALELRIKDSARGTGVALEAREREVSQ